MNRRFRTMLALVAAAAPAAVASASAPSPGTWRPLPKAPIAPNDSAISSVWTGRRMLVLGRVRRTSSSGAIRRVMVAAAYDPAANAWQRLPSPGPTSSFVDYSSVWTGKEMLVWGQGAQAAFNPRTNRWRRLPRSPLLSIHDGYGIVAWTGREMIGWGGGCCGDAFSDGVAYNPSTNRWRAVAPTPLAGSQDPIGAWTGRELVIFVGPRDPNGKPWPARLARAAAYNPATDTWRRIARMPAPRYGATAVWDGREILVVGGTGAQPLVPTRVGFAYNPATNRWRRLRRMPSGRWSASMVWTGKRLLIWGGGRKASADTPSFPPHGVAYDPRTNRWSALPKAPLEGRFASTAVWTGRSMIVWGGDGRDGATHYANGAAFTPAKRSP